MNKNKQQLVLLGQIERDYLEAGARGSERFILELFLPVVLRFCELYWLAEVADMYLREPLTGTQSETVLIAIVTAAKTAIQENHKEDPEHD